MVFPGTALDPVSFLSLFPWNSSLSKNGGIDYGSLKIGIIQTSERWERGLNVQHNRAFRKSGLYSDFVSTSSMIAMQICNLSYSYALSCMFLGKYFKWILSQQDQSSYIHTNFHPISCTWNFSVHLTNNNKHYVSTITHFGWASEQCFSLVCFSWTIWNEPHLCVHYSCLPSFSNILDYS